MTLNFLNNISKKAKMTLGLIVILLVGFFGLVFVFTSTKKVPDGFVDARKQASLTAQDIVSLSDESSKNISNISDLNAQQKYGEALDLVKSEIERNKEIRLKAISLSGNLGTMAQNAAIISPETSARLALDAISTETTLISHLITYNDYLNQLLNILESKFAGQETGKNNEINDLVNKINAEAKTVNDLNAQFNQKMVEFDKSK